MVHDNCILRDERDENEIKRLAELHFEQRKEDDAKLDELANLIETTKQVWSRFDGLAIMRAFSEAENNAQGKIGRRKSEE